MTTAPTLPPTRLGNAISGKSGPRCWSCGAETIPFFCRRGRRRSSAIFPMQRSDSSKQGISRWRLAPAKSLSGSLPFSIVSNSATKSARAPARLSSASPPGGRMVSKSASEARAAAMTSVTQVCCELEIAKSTPSPGGDVQSGALLAASCCGCCLVFVSGAVVNVALAAIGRDLELRSDQLQWIINAELLPLAALTLLGGALGGRYGQGRSFLIGVGVLSRTQTRSGRNLVGERRRRERYRARRRRAYPGPWFMAGDLHHASS